MTREVAARLEVLNEVVVVSVSASLVVLSSGGWQVTWRQARSRDSHTEGRLGTSGRCQVIQIHQIHQIIQIHQIHQIHQIPHNAQDYC